MNPRTLADYVRDFYLLPCYAPSESDVRALVERIYADGRRAGIESATSDDAAYLWTKLCEAVPDRSGVVTRHRSVPEPLSPRFDSWTALDAPTANVRVVDYTYRRLSIEWASANDSRRTLDDILRIKTP